MAPKHQKKTQRDRNWTENETTLFAMILANDDDGFCYALETLALKKKTNNEVFEHIKSKFEARLSEEEFHETNVVENFTSRRKTFEKLNTSVEKLRRKYANLKTKWKDQQDQAKRGSGLASEDEPGWYQHLNPIFSDTNVEINLSSSGNDLSFTGDLNLEHLDGLVDEGDDDDYALNDERRDRFQRDDSDEESEGHSATPEETPHTSDEASKAPRKKKLGADKTVVAPHQKKKKVRSQVEAQASMAASISEYSKFQKERWEASLKEEREREDRFLEFKREEADKNRAHELEMARIYATILGSIRGTTPPPPLTSPLEMLSRQSVQQAQVPPNVFRNHSNQFAANSNPTVQYSTVDDRVYENLSSSSY